jgi:vitamin B12 transporter
MSATSPHFLFATFLAAGGIAFAQSEENVAPLERVVVLAGQFPMGESPGAVLNSLEVVTTPGAAADINRALQTLPGVQLPDEGNALFVRGGDSFETVTLVNGLRYPSAVRLNAPAGNFAGTLNPFDAQRVTLASGGFGAGYGNALSAVVDLDTLAPPAINSASLGVGLGALSAGATAALRDDLGVRLTTTRTNTEPIMGLNGASRDYPEPPNGHEFSAAAAWNYRAGGQLKFFAVEQADHFALQTAPPFSGSLFRQSFLARLYTVTWSDAFGRWSPTLSVGNAELQRQETFGVVEVKTVDRQKQFAGRLALDASERLQFSLGADGAREQASLTKAMAPDAASGGFAFADAISPSRWGGFAEADAVVAPHVRAVAGARLDSSTLTHRTTADPRLSLAWEPRRGVSCSLAGGVYRQVPDAYDFLSDTGSGAPPPMRAAQVLAGLQLGQGDRLARIEVYRKDYADLVQLDRSFLPIAGGSGRAQGFDVMLKSSLPAATSGRLTYSFVDTRRTDPDSGRLAPAAFDVTHTLSLLLERAFGGWVASAAWRFASGRPFTPIISGQPDAYGGFAPVYGEPFSQRLPALQRLDLSASRYRRLNTHVALVAYVSINNALNRANVYAYEYTPDYAVRRPTPSLFNRSLYFGCTFLFN